MDARWEAIIKADPDTGPFDGDREVERMALQMERAAKLREADPRLPLITSITIASDQMTAERSERWMEQGMPFEVAYPFVGSYARFGFAVKALDEGKADRDWFFENLPHLWTSADVGPSDRHLELWKEAFDRNGHKPVTDGKPLPKGAYLKVYRGQDGDRPLGISWTLKREVADKFAHGAATRQANRGGTIFDAMWPRGDVLAYLTGRGEEEIILDPKYLNEALALERGSFSATVMDGEARASALRRAR